MTKRAYIRESYHGEPYPSKVFLPESFKQDTVKVTSEQLIQRLPETIKLAVERFYRVYNGVGDIRNTIQQYILFVEEVLMIEKEGKEPWVLNTC